MLIGCFGISRTPRSVNGQVFRLWRDQRKLQLIVSDDVVAEYLEVLARLRVGEPRVRRFAARLQQRTTVTTVRLGPRFTISRDPDDNLLLATAAVGKAQYLITNDRDLLDIATVQRRKFTFAIITPRELLVQLAE